MQFKFLQKCSILYILVQQHKWLQNTDIIQEIMPSLYMHVPQLIVHFKYILSIDHAHGRSHGGLSIVSAFSGGMRLCLIPPLTIDNPR